MNYSKYLQQISKVTAGSAIITLNGEHICHKGDWNATYEEEINY